MNISSQISCKLYVGAPYNLYFRPIRINPESTPLQHVTPIRRVANYDHGISNSFGSNHSAPDTKISRTPMFGGSKNDENLPYESLNNTSELKRQLDEEREKVKLLSSQLNTNVIIVTSIIAY